jgi:carboxylate-amine ligase
VADSCTRLEDTLAIAALYRCLVRMAVRKPELNRGLTGASRALVSENIWRAQRDGVHAKFLDEGSGTMVPFVTYLDAVLAEIAEDTEALGCRPEIERALVVAREGTSADHQLAMFASMRKETANMNEALAAVVDWIAGTTAEASTAPV